MRKGKGLTVVSQRAWYRQFDMFHCLVRWWSLRYILGAAVYNYFNLVGHSSVLGKEARLHYMVTHIYSRTGQHMIDEVNRERR